jgi:hypothetical protein
VVVGAAEVAEGETVFDDDEQAAIKRAAAAVAVRSLGARIGESYGKY